jgi:hypothetical protein
LRLVFHVGSGLPGLFLDEDLSLIQLAFHRGLILQPGAIPTQGLNGKQEGPV